MPGRNISGMKETPVRLTKSTVLCQNLLQDSLDNNPGCKGSFYSLKNG